MDNIITLIVIFIVLGSITRKLKARQKAKQGATPPDGGWLTKLKAVFSRHPKTNRAAVKRSHQRCFRMGSIHGRR
jgi:hypothetical protein